MPLGEGPAKVSLLLGVGAGAGVGSAGPNYTLMLWTAALVALVGAAVVLPIRKVK